jgi:hypothetical protein
MNNELIINGITYVRKEEPKAEEPRRIEGWICRKNVMLKMVAFSLHKYDLDDTKLIEIRDGERILSRDEIYNSIRTKLVVAPFLIEQILKDLGFDK